MTDHADQHRADLDLSPLRLDQIWTGVAAEAWSNPIGPVERVAGRLLRSPGLARSLIATRSLVLSWLLATAAVLAVGVVATTSTGTPWVGLLAPALAGIGVAYAYGPGVDPAFELSQSMAVSDRMVLLVRVLAVFAVNAVLGAAASLVSTQAIGLTFNWLAPMTTVAALALATATLSHSANTGVVAALGCWAFVTVIGFADSGRLGAAVDRVDLLPIYLLAAALCFGLALWATDGRRSEGFSWRST